MSSASAAVAAVQEPATYDMHPPVYRRRNQRAAQFQALHGRYSKTLLDFQRSNPEPDSWEEKYFTSQLAKISKEMAATASAEDQASEMMTQCSLFTARQLFCVWKAFDKIPAQAGADISIAELASLVDADEALVKRLVDVLVAHGVLARTNAISVAHTPRSLELREGHAVGKRCQLFWEVCMVPYAQEPKFFQAYGRKEPQTMNHVPSTFAYGCPEDSFYSMLQKDPERTERFGRQMRAMEINMPSAGIYDFSWLVKRVRQEEYSMPLLAGTNRKRAIFVDVGGGMGQASKAIMAENPGLPSSRFVLQDRAEVLAKVEALGDEDLRDVSKMAVDFHADQPVKGAYIYFIRRCLFNFPDSIAGNMLRIIAASMDPHESRLLIQEDVMDDPPNPRMAAMDMIMLSLGGKQRSLDKWRQLARQAGLRVVQVHRDRSGKSESLCVIECVRDDRDDTDLGGLSSATSRSDTSHNRTASPQSSSRQSLSPSTSSAATVSEKLQPPTGPMVASALALPPMSFFAPITTGLTESLARATRQARAWLWR
ncbi:S-adenosyl-L-methionine-dependent methyltransferase [Microdochium bolleyi]|uniref:S-adenosyl-L-methionine-dependent methyltransferase n=1 Tax=Microdochium bolleyi TaxID=196109 RepID=A0A136J414_9PEZI|nr:S-adenosyl-L-methionine-dependent methyltransferase [Microdochium bolleyi]